MDYLNYGLYIIFGTLPGIIWLFYYLKKDANPEPRTMILKIFFYGMLSTLPAVFLEMTFIEGISRIGVPAAIALFLNTFLAVALVEEFLKFAVIKLKVLGHPEFDEPIDSMIYMIVAGLGFATAENILVLFMSRCGIEQIFQISLLRFLGATPLHALASAIIGFFIGLAHFDKKYGKELILLGLALAVILHGFYNFSIMNPELLNQAFGITIKIEGIFQFLIPFATLLVAALFITFAFKRLDKIKGYESTSKKI